MSESAQAAKLIKQELKEKFPAIKFSVTSERFAGGDAVNVSYRNGVPLKEVDDVIGKYQYGHFDGMTDMYEYSNNNDSIPQAKYVHASRNIDPEITEKTKIKIAKDYGFDPTDEQEWMRVFNMWSDQKMWKELQDLTL